MATATKKRVFKTKKKLSNIAALYRKWSEWHEGDVIVGKYVGSKTDNYKKPNWLIEVEDATFVKKPKLAKSMIGKVIGLNSSGGLDRAMEEAEEGDLLQFTYEGKETMDGGPYAGKEKHLITVEEVAVEGEDDEEEEEEEDEDEDEDEDDEDDEDEDEEGYDL